MDKVWLVDETVLKLPKSGRLLGRLALLVDRVCRGGRSSSSHGRLLGNLFSLGRLDALQVDLLHCLQLHVSLRIAACTSTVLAEFVVLVQVELRALQVLVYVLTKHFFEVTVYLITFALLSSAHLALTQLVQIAAAVPAFRRLVSSRAKSRVMAGAASNRSTII